MNVELALKINKLVHDLCKEVPHDIGIRIMNLIRTEINEDEFEKLWISYKNKRLETMGNSQHWDLEEARKCFIAGLSHPKNGNL